MKYASRSDLIINLELKTKTTEAIVMGVQVFQGSSKVPPDSSPLELGCWWPQEQFLWSIICSEFQIRPQ